MKSLILALSCLLPMGLLAQTATDSLSKPSKPLKVEALRLGLDLKPLLQSAITNGFMGGSAYAELSLDNKYFLGATAGFANSNRTSEAQSGYRYRSEGQFLQLHYHYNVLYGSLSEDAFALGFAYGISRFQQSLLLQTSSDPWGTGNIEVARGAKLAHWMEGTGTLGVKAGKRICLQAVLRIRLLLSEKEDDALQTAEIPGFGVVKSRGGLGMAYRLLYVFGK